MFTKLSRTSVLQLALVESNHYYSNHACQLKHKGDAGIIPAIDTMYYQGLRKTPISTGRIELPLSNHACQP